MQDRMKVPKFQSKKRPKGGKKEGKTEKEA